MSKGVEVNSRKVRKIKIKYEITSFNNKRKTEAKNPIKSPAYPKI